MVKKLSWSQKCQECLEEFEPKLITEKCQVFKHAIFHFKYFLLMVKQAINV